MRRQRVVRTIDRSRKCDGIVAKTTLAKTVLHANRLCYNITVMGRRIYAIDYEKPVWKLEAFEYGLIKKLSLYKISSRKFHNDFDGDIWALDSDKIRKSFPDIVKIVEKLARKDDSKDKITKNVFAYYNDLQEKALKKEPAKKREHSEKNSGGKVIWYEMPEKWENLHAELFAAELYILSNYGSGIIYVEI